MKKKDVSEMMFIKGCNDSSSLTYRHGDYVGAIEGFGQLDRSSSGSDEEGRDERELHECR